MISIKMIKSNNIDILINWHQVCISYGFKSYELKTPDKGA